MGNKYDDPDRRVVPSNDGRRLAETMNIQFFETSAKENVNVEEVSVACCCATSRINLSKRNTSLQMFNGITQLVLRAKLARAVQESPSHGGGVRLDARQRNTGGGAKGCKCS